LATSTWQIGKVSQPASLGKIAKQMVLFHTQELYIVIRVICKVTVSFTPYSLFQWYPQSEEECFEKSQYEMLKLGI
jgi:hypothetical protein